MNQKTFFHSIAPRLKVGSVPLSSNFLVERKNKLYFSQSLWRKLEATGKLDLTAEKVKAQFADKRIVCYRVML